MLDQLVAALPFMYRALASQVLANLDAQQRARLDAHTPVAMAAAARNDATGQAAFQRALDEMGIGLFARQLWPFAVAQAARNNGHYAGNIASRPGDIHG